MTDKRAIFISLVQRAFSNAHVGPVERDQLWVIRNGHHTFDIPIYIHSLDISNVRKLAITAGEYFVGEIMKDDNESQGEV